MFDLATLSSAVLLGAGIGTLVLILLLALVLRKPRRRGRQRRVDRGSSDRCSMCQRPTPSAVMQGWNIRNVQHRVCDRCHPFYKMRFGGVDVQPGAVSANAPTHAAEPAQQFRESSSERASDLIEDKIPVSH